MDTTIQDTQGSDGREPAQTTTPVLKRLIGISVPVTAGRLIGSFSYLLESIITVRSLALAGIAAAAATAQYGSLQGMVIPLLLLPGVLSSSLAASLVPSLSEAAARNDLPTIHKRMHQALRLAMVTGAPFAAVMYILAVPLCSLMYGNAADTAPMLRMMAPFAVFLYVQAPLQAALQAMDRPGKALINTLIGAIVKNPADSPAGLPARIRNPGRHHRHYGQQLTCHASARLQCSQADRHVLALVGPAQKSWPLRSSWPPGCRMSIHLFRSPRRSGYNSWQLLPAEWPSI
ncbi:lipid II flippase MurJ [Paenibacillus rhizoplanae]